MVVVTISSTGDVPVLIRSITVLDIEHTVNSFGFFFSESGFFGVNLPCKEFEKKIR